MTATPPIAANLGDDFLSAALPSHFVERRLSVPIPALDQWQIEAVDSQAKGILMLCGRQTGKSTAAAVIAIHAATLWPGELVLMVSPTQRQSSELFRKSMVLLDALDGAPETDRRTQTEVVLANGSSIVSLPGSNPDKIRGFSRPSLIIEDEAAFVRDETFVTSSPMLATIAHGRHILMTTPYGKRGHFYEQWTSGDPYWQRIEVRSSMCPRIGTDFLERERRKLSDRAYRQEYECEFLESAISVFPADWIERLVDDDERHGVVLPDEVTVGQVRAVDPGPWAALG